MRCEAVFGAMSHRFAPNLKGECKGSGIVKEKAIAIALICTLAFLAACSRTISSSSTESEPSGSPTSSASDGPAQPSESPGGKDASSTASDQGDIAQPSATESAQAPAASQENSRGKTEYEIDTREIWVDNGNERIYGVASVPRKQGRCPLVVFSHELGNTHKAGSAYAEALAARGCAVYAFDFRGGSRNGNRSDGSNVDMSVLTEVSDLSAVVNAAQTWDFVDPERIVLLGGSQGGCVSAIYASQHPETVAGLILLYPAFSIPESVRSSFESLEDVPPTYGMFGGWITVGRKYAKDVWDLDPYDQIGTYRGKVLIIHGDKDDVVDIAYSQRAADVYDDCDLCVIPGAGHGFEGEDLALAMEHIVSYMQPYL